MNEDTIKNFLSEIDMLRNNCIDVSRKLLEDGKENVTVNLARTKLMPDRMESPPRSHVFYDVCGFISFVKKNKTDNTLVMAHVDRGVIEAVLDDRAEKGYEVVRLRPEYYPAYMMLQKMIGERMSLRIFAEHVMRNREVLGETKDEGREYAIMFQQLTVASKIEACTGSGKKSVNGVMVTMEIKGGHKGSEIVDLPDTLRASVPIYINRPNVQFGIDITLTANTQGEVYVHADAPELEVLKYQEIQVIADEVKNGLSKDVMVASGFLDTSEWNYNK